MSRRFASLKAAALAGAAIVASAGVAAANEALLVGTWACSTAYSEGPATGAGAFDYTFQQGGASQVYGTLTVVAPEGTVEATIGGVGTWSISGDMLMENFTSVELLSFSYNGQAIPPSDLPPDVASSLAGAGASQIVSLDASTLVLRDAVTETNCSRQ